LSCRHSAPEGLDGAERGARFVTGFLTPDFTTRWRDISQGLVESLTMTFTSTVAGVLIVLVILATVVASEGISSRVRKAII